MKFALYSTSQHKYYSELASISKLALRLMKQTSLLSKQRRLKFLGGLQLLNYPSINNNHLHSIKIMHRQEQQNINKIPSQYSFDFKVKVNYQNGNVSLTGPNAYSPPPPPNIIYMQHHNKPSSVTTKQNIEYYNQQPQPKYQSYSYIPFQNSAKQLSETSVSKKQNSTVECVICEQSFTSDQFQQHLELHRRRTGLKNNQKQQTTKNEFCRNNNTVYSFKNIDDSAQFKKVSEQNSPNASFQIYDEPNSSPSNIQYQIREQTYHNSSQNSIQHYPNSAYQNSINDESQNYLQSILHKKKKFRSEDDNNSSSCKNIKINTSQSMAIKVQDHFNPMHNNPSKNMVTNDRQSISSEVKSNIMKYQDNKSQNSAINLRNKLKEGIKGVSSRSDTFKDSSDNSSDNDIEDVKQSIENLNRDQLVKMYHTRKSQQSVISEHQIERPKRPSERSIHFSSQILQMPRKSLSFFSEQNQQQTIFEEPRKSASQMRTKDFMIFRGVQAEESQINDQMKHLKDSVVSKSSTKSKLPKNYFAVTDILENSRKQ